MRIRPFVVDVTQATMDDLRDRLARTHRPDEVEGAGWDYGANLASAPSSGRSAARPDGSSR
jgi:hypothetical protein